MHGRVEAARWADGRDPAGDLPHVHNRQPRHTPPISGHQRTVATTSSSPRPHGATVHECSSGAPVASQVCCVE